MVWILLMLFIVLIVVCSIIFFIKYYNKNYMLKCNKKIYQTKKFFICEGISAEKYNASTKARKDCEEILKKIGFKEFYINSKNGNQTNKLMKWKQIIFYFINRIIWIKSLRKLKNADIVVIQYPLIYTILNINSLIKKYTKKGIVFIAIIHDLDSLRYSEKDQSKAFLSRVNKEDKEVLNNMSYVIAHNEHMKQKLCLMGIDESKIISLNLFDYLIDTNLKKKKRNLNDSIIIAGNLSLEKSTYLSKLHNLKNIKFNLYGAGFVKNKFGNNVTYKGKFLPNELVNHLEGSFGLVWDGTSINTCSGGFGEYLKYNNPHKASLYLTSGLPIIVWEKSALASFVIENKIGFVVNSLNEIQEKISNLSQKEYDLLLKNVKKISDRTSKGKYLEEALNKIL